MDTPRNTPLPETIPLPHHPNPILCRETWRSLNGTWQFSDGRAQLDALPQHVIWDRTITVPFSPETANSGIADEGFYRTVWYRRTFTQEALSSGERLLLHFEAVDWRATVWVNGKRVATHEGGYTPFHADITEALLPGVPQEIIVRAEDEPSDLAKPRGKQDWKAKPHSIWYPRTTGIWQTVWLETVSPIRLKSLHWTSSLDRWEIGLEALILGDGALSSDEPATPVDLQHRLQLSVRLTVGDQLLADDTYTVIAGEVHRRLALSDPGIDDFRNTLLWSPGSPTLIDATLELRSEGGVLLDRVLSYTALRSVATQGDRFILNGRPLPLRLVLDQGYWPESGLTAPSDEALVRDIKLVKELGFNGVRKHQKIECARFLYWADRLGLLVWEEMPSAYRYTNRSIHRLTREWMDVIHRDRSHPSIITWVPFNESWGVPDLPEVGAQRHFVQSLYHLTHALDPSRPVIGNDGWEYVATDIIGIHDYDDRPARIGRRYGIDNVESQLLHNERPGGRLLALTAPESGSSPRPLMITEFGGIAFASPEAADPLLKPEEAWGYSRAETSEQLLDRYSDLLLVVRSLPALAGFCYTQFTDTYQEVNGLLFADRTPKAPLDAIRKATSGSLPDLDPQVEAFWRADKMTR